MKDLLEQLAALRSDNDRLTRELAAERAARDIMRQEHERLVVRLTTELAILRRRVFGQKAERLKNEAAQQSLLDILADLALLKKGDGEAGERAEAMLGELKDEAGSGTPTDDEPGADAPPRTRKARKATPHGRRKPEEHRVATESIVLEPPERAMPEGEKLTRIGDERSSFLEHRPASVVRVEVIRPKYMRPEQTGTDAASAPTAVPEMDDGRADPAPRVMVYQAQPLTLPIPKGLAGPALLAHVLVSKYADHLPLHRQERIFKREGVYLPRSTLCGFVQGSVALLRHIVEAMWVDAKANSLLILTDACGVLVRDKDRCHRGHFQVFIAPGRHVFFAYLRHNNGEAVAKLLEGFSGKLQSDASAVYHETFRRQPAIMEVGCWAHARRGLYEALPSARKLALIGIGFIRLLYDAQDAATDEHTGAVDGAKRRKLAEPVLAELKEWVARTRPLCPPGYPLETALGYLERQWIPLTRFLDDAALRLDNNPSEFELRHQKVGGNNWLFCATDGGAEWNATVVSLIASCRIHGVEPYGYLRDVLTLLPDWPVTRALELAPANWENTAKDPKVQQQLDRVQPLRLLQAHAALDTAPSAS